MPNGLRPDIIVEQVFDTPQPTVPATILPVCLIGLNRQLEWQKVAGSFVGGQPGQQYLFPDLVAGAVVEDSTAVLDVPEFPDVLKPHVYIQNEHGLGEVLGGDLAYALTTDPPTFSISPSASVTFEIATGVNGSYSAASGYFVNNDADFIEDQIAANDEIEVLHNDGNYYKAFDVVDILSDNQLDVTRSNKATLPAIPTALLSAQDAFGFRTLDDINQQFMSMGVDIGDLVTVDGFAIVTSVLGGNYGAAGTGIGTPTLSRLFSDSAATFLSLGVTIGDVIFSADAIGDWVPFFYVKAAATVETQIDDVENIVTTPAYNPPLTQAATGVPYAIQRYSARKNMDGLGKVDSTTGEYGDFGVNPWGVTLPAATNRIFHDPIAIYNAGGSTVVVGDEIIINVMGGPAPYFGTVGNWPKFVIVNIHASGTELEVSQHDSNDPSAPVVSPSAVAYEIRNPGALPIAANTAGSYTVEGGGGAPAGQRRITATGKNFSTAGVVAGDFIRNLAGTTLFTVVTVHPAGIGTLNVQNIIPGNPPPTSSSTRFAFYVTDQSAAILEVVSVDTETSLTCKNTIAGTPNTGAHPGVFITAMTYPDVGQDIVYKIKKTQTGAVLAGDVLCTYAARRNDYLNQITPVDINTYQTVVGPPVPGNDLSLAFKKLFEVLGAVSYFIQVPNDTLSDWTEALNLAANGIIYIPVALTQREDIIQLMNTHVTHYSEPEKKRERITYVCHKEVVQTTRRTGTVGMTYSKSGSGVTSVVSTAVDLTAYGVIVGDVLTGTFDDGTSTYDISEARIISILPSTPAVGQSTMRIVASVTVPSPSSGTVTSWDVKSKPLSLLQRAQQQAAYTTAIKNRRLRNLWPDKIEDIFTDETAGEGVSDGFFGGGDQIATLGGHFLTVTEAGKRANENPSQPLTNFPKGTVHKIIDPMGDNIDYQDIILNGGNYYMEHDGIDQPPKAIRAISTDVSELFKMEDNVPSQIDSFARKLRTQLKPLLGPIVIDEPFFDLISTNIQAVKDDVLQEKEMREIVFLSIEEDPNQADQFLAKFRVKPFISGAKGIITIYI